MVFLFLNGNVNAVSVEVKLGKIKIFEVTRNMKLKCGGVEERWMQVIDVDINQDDNYPGTWHKIITSRRLCVGYVAGCASAHFYSVCEGS